MAKVAAGMSLDALVTNLDQIFTFTKGQGLLGTDIDAGRRQTILQPGFVAEDAFFDDRIEGAGVAVSRDIEWAGDHTVATADTDLGVVDNCTFLGLGVGIDKTGAQTGGLVAMVALHLAIEGTITVIRAVAIDHGVGVFIGSALLLAAVEGFFKDRLVIERPAGSRQVLLFVAGRLATAATDATGQIHQHPHTIRITFKGSGRHGLFRASQGCGGTSCKARSKKSPSTDSTHNNSPYRK